MTLGLPPGPQEYNLKYLTSSRLITMSYSPQVEFVKAWLHGFETGDLDLLERSFHKDFRQITRPQVVGREARNKYEYAEYLRQTIPQWTKCKVSYLSC